MPEDTQPGPGDETRHLPPPAVDETAAAGANDTQAMPQPDETRAMPQPDDTRAMPQQSVWSGRAEVPVGRPPAPTTMEWEQPPPNGGRWWMPILVGVIALALVGVLSYGLWLIATAEDETPPASPTATAAPNSAKPSPTPEPSPTPSPEEIEVPPLAGEQVADAQAMLDELGLRYRVRFEQTDEQEPGTVIRTRPEQGSRVKPGTRITLIVAAAPPVTAPPTPSATATAGT